VAGAHSNAKEDIISLMKKNVSSVRLPFRRYVTVVLIVTDMIYKNVKTQGKLKTHNVYVNQAIYGNGTMTTTRWNVLYANLSSIVLGGYSQLAGLVQVDTVA
jgi:hypothetical protein